MLSLALMLLLQQGSWIAAPPMPDARQEVAVVALEGQVYVIGGLATGGAPSARVDAFDTRANEWRSLPSFPITTHHPMAAAIGNKIYVAGGYTDPGFTPHGRTYEFNPDSSVWTRKADMPTVRGAGAAVAYGGKLYVFGGERDGLTVNEVASYDPLTDQWTVLAPMPTARNHMGASEVRGRIHVVGGRPLDRATNEMFDPLTEAWSTKAPMPTGRSGHAVATVGGYLYAFGGEGNPASPVGTFAQNEAYDVDADTWSSAENMPVARHGIGAGVIGNRIFVPVGGVVEGYSTTTYSDFFEAAQDFVLPQFVVGGGYRTEIVVSNPASRPADVSIAVTDINGSPLSTLLDGVVRATVSFTLPPLASRTLSAPDASGALRAGVVRVRSNARLSAFGVVRAAGLSATTVYPVASARSGMFHVRLLRSDSTNTGIAIANLDIQPASLTLRLISDSGAEVARLDSTIPAGGQLARFVDEFFGSIQSGDFVGTMTVVSTRPISIVALAFSRDGVVTIPVVPVE